MLFICGSFGGQGDQEEDGEERMVAIFDLTSS